MYQPEMTSASEHPLTAKPRASLLEGLPQEDRFHRRIRLLAGDPPMVFGGLKWNKIGFNHWKKNMVG
jgi:hypothetical protein